ncbi:hypothetical protein PR048_031417 [Dryococelus australis]|uniref:Uncharacterized protein n=1 Tax=Dryococelus australis TaxID=614101 RepID=A0ABQ9G997_9NEOP|nr:hypothetical protein PR048_031417 [Dryococelus australis]
MAPGIVILEVTWVYSVKTPQCWQHFIIQNVTIGLCVHATTDKHQRSYAEVQNTPTSGVVRHDSHLRKSGSDPAGDRTRFALTEGEQSNHSIKRRGAPVGAEFHSLVRRETKAWVSRRGNSMSWMILRLERNGAGSLRVRGRGHSTVGCHGGPAERLVSCVRARRRLVARADSWESRSGGRPKGYPSGSCLGRDVCPPEQCAVSSHLLPTAAYVGDNLEEAGGTYLRYLQDTPRGPRRTAGYVAEAPRSSRRFTATPAPSPAEPESSRPPGLWDSSLKTLQHGSLRIARSEYGLTCVAGPRHHGEPRRV